MRLHRPLHRRLPRQAAVLALAVAALSASKLYADDVIYGPDGAPTVLQHKLYEMSNRWELGLRLQTAINTPLVTHYGGILDFTYHPNESFDVGLEGFGNYTALSNLSDVIREKLGTRSSSAHHDELANADQMRFGALAIARIAPIYGKINLASEVKIHFQTYLLAGVGAAAFHHESVNVCAASGTGICPEDQFEQSDFFTVVGEVGGGFRFYFSNDWSMSTEVRAFLFPTQYKANNDLTDPQDSQPGTGVETSYLGTIVTFSIGLERMF
jgi:outer membrane beta-barrel protein